MIPTDRITEMFCSIDDFYLVFEPALQKTCRLREKEA
jgi:hypothetical protein